MTPLVVETFFGFSPPIFTTCIYLTGAGFLLLLLYLSVSIVDLYGAGIKFDCAVNSLVNGLLSNVIKRQLCRANDAPLPTDRPIHFRGLLLGIRGVRLTCDPALPVSQIYYIDNHPRIY